MINKYHTVIVFRILDPLNEFENKLVDKPTETLIFFNPFKPKLKFVSIFELAMNDDHFDMEIIKNYPIKDEKGASFNFPTDRIIFTGLRKGAIDQLIVRIEGFDVYMMKNKDNKNIISVKKIIDDK
jgi:hypothetical protein